MPVIELKDVSKLYGFGDATTVALEEVSLKVDQGEFVAVMGPSGCGKSTLLNIVGLLDRPTHGHYSLNGKSVSRLSANARARRRRDTIGFVFQSFNLLPRLSVLENVALPLAYKGVPTVKRLQQASDMLQMVGLLEREYFTPKQLSGGQIQRVAIARALINRPSIIIADEPTGNLDSASSRLVMELLSEIHKSGNTIIMVTHNPGLTRYAGRVVYMQDGQIVHDEPSDIGIVAERARRMMFGTAAITVEDDLEGVSLLMNAVPGGQTQPKKPKPAKNSKKRLAKKRSGVKK